MNGTNPHQGCRAIVVVPLLFLVAFCCTSTGEPTSECIADLRVYAPDGRPLKYSVSSVTLQTYPNIDLLQRPVDGLRTQAVGSVLHYFGRLPERNRPDVRIELRGEFGDVARRLVLPGCGSRVAMFHGITGPESETPEAEIAGTVKGCAIFGDDWWVRLMPLFEKGDAAADAQLRPDGSFRFFHYPEAARHVIMVGRGSEIVRAKSIDFEVLPKIRLEPIDITGTCP